MTKREAIEILEEVKTLDDSMFTYSQAYNDALDMAIEALKPQEPRVMTLEELNDLYSQETIWFEEKPNHTIKQLTQDGIVTLIFVGLLHNWNGYGIVWRCWTSRPTDEQREEIPWN